MWCQFQSSLQYTPSHLARVTMTKEDGQGHLLSLVLSGNSYNFIYIACSGWFQKLKMPSDVLLLGIGNHTSFWAITSLLQIIISTRIYETWFVCIIIWTVRTYSCWIHVLLFGVWCIFDVPFHMAASCDDWWHEDLLAYCAFKPQGLWFSCRSVLTCV